MSQSDSRWRASSGPPLRLVGSIAFQLIDDFASAPPRGAVTFTLEQLVGDTTGWEKVQAQGRRSAGGVLSYAGLGFAPDPAATPLRRFRLRHVDEPPRAQYRAAYRTTIDALEFDVPTYNHQIPPATDPGDPERLVLYPGAAYPFPSYLTVLRGTVRDATGPVADVLISAGTDNVLSNERGAFSLPLRLNTDRDAAGPVVDALVLSNERGAFSLPLRLREPASTIPVFYEHLRTGRSASITVPLPAATLDLVLS